MNKCQSIRDGTGSGIETLEQGIRSQRRRGFGVNWRLSFGLWDKWQDAVCLMGIGGDQRPTFQMTRLDLEEREIVDPLFMDGNMLVIHQKMGVYQTHLKWCLTNK